MQQTLFRIKANQKIASSVFRMELEGDTKDISKPGQFVNIRLNWLFLRRPISVCDLEGNTLTIINKAVGEGTELMSSMAEGTKLDILTGLGNGYDTDLSGDEPLLLGGGVGIPPLYLLAKRLLAEGKKVTAVLGFNTKDEIFYENEFRKLGAETIVTTADGSYGVKGFVTDAIPAGYSHFYACGPEAMLKAVFKCTKTSGQLSFERRMGCGFGACMGCSCRTVTGYKRICKEGPVMMKEDILWED